MNDWARINTLIRRGERLNVAPSAIDCSLHFLLGFVFNMKYKSGRLLPPVRRLIEHSHLEAQGKSYHTSLSLEPDPLVG